jgi:hypothetical protein
MTNEENDEVAERTGTTKIIKVYQTISYKGQHIAGRLIDVEIPVEVDNLRDDMSNDECQDLVEQVELDDTCWDYHGE